MRRNINGPGWVLLTAIVALAFSPALAGKPPIEESFTFNLLLPNSAEDSSGNNMTVTGAGFFGTTGDVHGGGSFTETDSAGNIVASGHWQITGFTNFESFGGPNPGFQGGILDIESLFVGNDGTERARSMTITCLVNRETGFPELVEGVNIDGFDDSTGGFTLFHLNTR